MRIERSLAGAGRLCQHGFALPVAPNVGYLDTPWRFRSKSALRKYMGSACSGVAKKSPESVLERRSALAHGENQQRTDP